MKSPKVSIILPTYNGQAYLRQSVESCLQQTYREIELIIVDDGSTDKTPQLIAAWSDPRIKVIRLQVNSGHIQALNRGFVASTGDFLTWTSDDNWYDLRAIEVMVGELKRRPSVDFVYSRYHVIDHHGNVTREGRVENPGGLDIDNCIGGCFLYRRKVYETVGDFNPEAFLAEDYEYWLRVRQKFRMRKIDRPLYYYRLHEVSLTGRHKEEAVQKKVKLIRNRFIRPWKREFLIAQETLSAGDHPEASHALAHCLKLNPWYAPAWRLWALLHLNPSLIVVIRKFKQALIGR